MRVGGPYHNCLCGVPVIGVKNDINRIADGPPDYIRNHSEPVVQHFIKGQVSDEEIEILRVSGQFDRSKLLPDNIRQPGFF